NPPTFQYESEEDIFDNFLENNYTPIVPYEFSSSLCSLEYFTSPNLEYSISPSHAFNLISAIPLESSSSHNLECIASFPNLEYSTFLIYASKYSISSYNSEQSTLLLNNSEAIHDTSDYSNSSNIQTLQTAKKHKLVFVSSSDKKPTWKKLEPFVKATSLIGRDTYSTLSLILLTITTLQEHLLKVESVLTHSVVHNVRNEIEFNIAGQWEDLVIEGYLASILDSRFKNLEFASEKFEETKTSLRQQMRMLNKNE
ncbi:11481_t:CDS:2, partial [Dentiscutata erythropus]